jgi:WD40 repeat protein
MSELRSKLVRIFISSPSDVAEERKAAAELIEDELAKREAFVEKLKLRAFRYDDPNSDTPFLAGHSPQASVDQRMRSADAQIVVAILWARMGTPVRDPRDPAKILYQSGTEQEVEEALKAGREVLVYFRRGQPSMPDNDDLVAEALAQRKEVRAFIARLKQQGRGVNEYQDVRGFRRQLEQHLDQILTQIRDASIVPVGQVTTAPEPRWTGDPYPGLRSFELEEAPIFFGRREETAELVRWVVEEGRRFVAVVGVSGSGKSSLVKAGMAPKLPGWPCVIVRLAGDPFHALAIRLETFLPASHRRAFQDDPAKQLAAPGWIDDLLKDKPASACLLIVIDQFEELQTAVPENFRAAFVGLLKALADHNRVRIVVSLRADFLGAMSRDEILARVLRGNGFVLDPPGPAALRAIIREPARLVRVTIEDSLIDELVEAARHEPGALPLLAFALERLYSRREGKQLVLPAVVGSARLGPILSDHTREVEDALPAEQREELPRLFRHLVRVEDGARRIAKRRCRPADLGDDEILIALRNRLIEARLLTALDDAAEGVEVAHEVLLDAWPSLQDWVAAYRTHLVVRDDVERLRANGAPRLEGWLLERALDLTDEAPELLDTAQMALVRRSGQENQDFLGREANAVADRAAVCIKEGDCATAIALCLEVLPPTPPTRRPVTSLALSTLHEAWRSIRELRIIETGQGAVWAASFSPDGMRVVSAGHDGTVRLWHLDGTGEPLILRGHEDIVRAASFSPDGMRVVSAGEDGTVRLWPTDGSGEPLILRGHKGRVSAASFSPDGRRIVSCGEDGTVRLWYTDGVGEVLLPHGRWVRTASFSPDGTRVVSAGDDGTVRLWRADGQGEPLILKGHVGGVSAASFSPDGTRLVSAGQDGTVRLWGAVGLGEPLIVWPSQHMVLAASFSPDGTRIVSAGQDGTVRLWRADRIGKPLLLGGHESWVRAASFSPDGTKLISAADDGTMRLWCTDRGSEPLILHGHGGWALAASFSPDGRLVVSASDDSTVRLWQADGSGKPVILPGHAGGVFAASFSADGKRVVVGSGSGTVRIWPADGNPVPLRLRGHKGRVRAASFSPDGRRVVSAGDDGTVRIWHTDSTSPPLILEGHEDWVVAASFDPKGKRVVSASGDGTVRVWQADGSGEPLILRGHDGRVRTASFSPDGTLLVSAGVDGTVRIWQADGKGKPLILCGHNGVVWAASFSPDRTRVVSAGGDGTVRLWHADGVGEPLILRGHEHEVFAASFSPDGRRVVSAGRDGTVRIWYVLASEHELIEAARASLPRQLTDAQRAKYHLPLSGV